MHGKTGFKSTLGWDSKLRCLHCSCQNYRSRRFSFSLLVANGAPGSPSKGPGRRGRRKGECVTPPGRRISGFGVSSGCIWGQVAAGGCQGAHRRVEAQVLLVPLGNRDPGTRCVGPDLIVVWKDTELCPLAIRSPCRFSCGGEEGFIVRLIHSTERHL